MRRPMATSPLSALDDAPVWLNAEPRMYQLVRQQDAGARTFEIVFDDPGVRAYVFTFG
jgi:Thioredoxin like C-terminal domain